MIHIRIDDSEKNSDAVFECGIPLADVLGTVLMQCFDAMCRRD